MMGRLNRLGRASLCLACVAGPLLWARAAQAQVGESMLLPAVIPQGFSRGRNQSVLELPRRAYDPVGIRVGSFNLLPSVDSSGGVTSNTYSTVDPIASAFVSSTAQAQIVSRWSRHFLSFTGTGTIRDYIGQSRRNETAWSADTRGRVDLGRFGTITLAENSSQQNENPFTGEVTPVVAAVSRYRRDFVSAVGVYQAGRIRATLGADYATFRFLPVPLIAGGTIDQSNRNRTIGRITGQLDIAKTPSLAFFVQGAYADQQYQTDLRPGVPNLGYTAYRFMGGTNFDLAGTARGSIAIGYTSQTFKSPLYKPADGLSIEARLELFPTRLTTVTLVGRRVLEVSNAGVSGAFWDNRLSARVDREIWRSIIVNATADISRQTYVVTSASARSYQFGLGARYLSGRTMVLHATANYGNRTSASTTLGNTFTETRGEVGLTFRI